jgi:hypothetical protein
MPCKTRPTICKCEYSKEWGKLTMDFSVICLTLSYENAMDK